MELFFGILAIIAVILISLFISGVNAKKTHQVKLGFVLILFSFLCGILLMTAAIISG